MTRLWEYRIHTVTSIGPDEGDSRLLTNIARPATHEQGHADGWEIFAVLPSHGGIRLYMKRPMREG